MRNVTHTQNRAWQRFFSTKFECLMASADHLYRRILAYARFFSKGWGPVDTYEKLLDYRRVLFSREGCAEILRKHPQKVTITEVRKTKEGVIYDAEFFSPLAAYLPGMLPKTSEMARFEMILPHSWNGAERPVYIHLAGTGDHYFWRRRVMTALPTLRASSIGAVSLENPYYGTRKPPEQTRSQLQHVSDLFVMGMALILECMVIMHWLEEKGLGPVGLTGFSMGGHNCSLAAALWPKAVAVVPCLSWSTASSSFTEGLLSRTVCWDVLQEQLHRSQTGRDERRRECLRRIRDLEEAEHATTTTAHRVHHPASVGHQERETALSGGSWNMYRATTSSGGSQLSQSVLRVGRVEGGGGEREGEQEGGEGGGGGVSQAEGGRTVERGSSPLAMASIPGPAHLLHQVLAGVGRRVQSEVVERGREWQRKRNGERKGSGLPRPELLGTMRMVLDSATHHQYFPTPVNPALACFITAEDDMYIPRGHLADVRSLWKGCKVKYVKGGHISATVLNQNTVHQALKNTIQRVYV